MERKAFISKGKNIDENELNEENTKEINTKFYKSKCFLLIFIIFMFGCLLVGLVLFLKFSPGCPNKMSPKWWQKELFYQIEVSNFKDSDDDGIGDIDGI
jgi:hypothetical protein